MALLFAGVIFFVYLCSRKGLDSNMTTLTHSEKEAIMKDMKSFDEPMPAVGIIPKSRVVVWLGLWTILWSLSVNGQRI